MSRTAKSAPSEFVCTPPQLLQPEIHELQDLELATLHRSNIEQAIRVVAAALEDVPLPRLTVRLGLLCITTTHRSIAHVKLVRQLRHALCRDHAAC